MYNKKNKKISFRNVPSLPVDILGINRHGYVFYKIEDEKIRYGVNHSSENE